MKNSIVISLHLMRQIDRYEIPVDVSVAHTKFTRKSDRPVPVIIAVAIEELYLVC